MSLRQLPVKQLRAIWLQRYEKATKLNQKLKTARRKALIDPQQSNQAEVANLERQVETATNRAIEIRDALEQAKYGA